MHSYSGYRARPNIQPKQSHPNSYSIRLTRPLRQAHNHYQAHEESVKFLVSAEKFFGEYLSIPKIQSTKFHNSDLSKKSFFYSDISIINQILTRNPLTRYLGNPILNTKTRLFKRRRNFARSTENGLITSY